MRFNGTGIGGGAGRWAGGRTGPPAGIWLLRFNGTRAGGGTSYWAGGLAGWAGWLA